MFEASSISSTEYLFCKSEHPEHIDLNEIVAQLTNLNILL